MKTSIQTVEKKARTLIEKALENGYCLYEYAGVVEPEGRCCLLGMVMAGGDEVQNYVAIDDVRGDYRAIAGKLLGLTVHEAHVLEAGFEDWNFIIDSDKGLGAEKDVRGTPLHDLGKQLRQDYMETKEVKADDA
jgi:hypothetical protein